MGKSEVKPSYEFDGVPVELAACVSAYCERLAQTHPWCSSELRKYVPIVLPSPAPNSTVVQGVVITPAVVRGHLKIGASTKLRWTYRVYKGGAKVFDQGLIAAPKPVQVLPHAFFALVQQLELEGFLLHTRFAGPLNEHVVALPHISPQRSAIATVLNYLVHAREFHLRRLDASLSGKHTDMTTQGLQDRRFPAGLMA